MPCIVIAIDGEVIQDGRQGKTENKMKALVWHLVKVLK